MQNAINTSNGTLELRK